MAAPDRVAPDDYRVPMKNEDTRANCANAEVANATGQLCLIVDALVDNVASLSDAEKAAFLQGTKLVRDAALEARDVAGSMAKEQARMQRPPTVTAIPLLKDLTQGGKNDCQLVKSAKLLDYNGEPDGPVDLLSWLDQCLTAAAACNLTEEAALDLLRYKASSMAREAINQMKRDGQGLVTVISELEVTFAKIPPPAEARFLANNLSMIPGEDIGVFAIRLRKMCAMATRDILDVDKRHKEEIELCKNNFKRVIPNTSHQHLIKVEGDMARAGRPPMPYREMVATVSTYQDQNKARRQRELAEKQLVHAKLQLASHIPKHLSRYQTQVRQLEEGEGEAAAAAAEAWVEDPELTEILGGPEETEFIPTDLETDTIREQICLVHEKFEKGQAGRYPPGGYRGRYGGGRGYGGGYRGGRPWAEREQHARAIHDLEHGTGQDSSRSKEPPKLLNETFPRIGMGQMLRLANCDGEPDRCCRCGVITSPPHKMRDGHCVLADIDLTDQACLSCGKGLHASRYCPMAFQQNFKHPADIVAKN